MSLLGADRKQLNYKQEEGTIQLRSFVESTIVSETPDIDRITRYTLYWHFYHGKHWRQYSETLLSFNYVKAFIDKINNFLLGRRSFSFKVEPFEAVELTEDQEKNIEGVLEKHWRKNLKNTKMHDILQMGSICGDVWVHLGWDVEEKYVKISVPDSRHCFPAFKNGDINKLDKFTIRQPLEKNKENYVVFVVEYTKDTVTQWYQRDTSVEGKRIEEREIKNSFGFIPVVHIKNKPTSDGYYSYSDARDILKINKVYNELAQELKNIIDYYGTPTTVITGGTAKTLRKGLGNIWSGLPPEANVFNLGLGEDLSSSINFMATLKTSMHELSDVPENTLGKIQAISNTSAAALQVTYQPLIMQADLKWLTYGDGVTAINSLILKILQIMDEKAYTAIGVKDIDKEYQILPVFDYGLPYDRLQELNQANMELQMKIGSRREVMNRLNKRNVPKLLAEIEEDVMRQNEMNTPIQNAQAENLAE